MSISSFDNHPRNYLKFFINLLDPIPFFGKDNKLNGTDRNLFILAYKSSKNISFNFIRTVHDHNIFNVHKNCNNNIDNNKNAENMLRSKRLLASS